MNKETELFSEKTYEDISLPNYWACLGENGGIIADTTNYIERQISQKLLNYESINPVNLENRVDYLTKTENKTAHFDSNVLSMRNFLFEIDAYSLEEQKIYVKNLIKKGIINRAVFSGNKSIHCRITINKEPKNKDIYKLVWYYFDKTCFDGKTDKQCSNPTRFTRRPNYINQKTEKKQLLVYSSNTILPVSAFVNDIAKKHEAEKEKEETQRILRIMNADNNNHNNNWKNYVKKAVENSDSTDGNRHHLFGGLALCVFKKHNMNVDYDEFVDYFNSCLDDPLSKDAIKAMKHTSGYRRKLLATKQPEKEQSVKEDNPIFLYNVSKYTIGDFKKWKAKQSIQEPDDKQSNKVLNFVSTNPHKSDNPPVPNNKQTNNVILFKIDDKPITDDDEPSYVECFLYGKNYAEELEKQNEIKYGKNYLKKLERQTEQKLKKALKKYKEVVNE
jgi:hypothetical protein